MLLVVFSLAVFVVKADVSSRAVAPLLANSNEEKNEDVIKKIDLSYLHNIPAAKLANALEQEQRTWHDDDDYACRRRLLLDVSHSCLGDSGFQTLLNVLLSSDTTPAAPTEIEFLCRMNDLTPLSAKLLFERMLLQSGDSSTVSSLDLSFNHLDTDELGGDDENFDPLLEKVVAGRSGLRHLAMDHCGLGPAGCRALAQGVLQRHSTAKEEESTAELSLSLARNPAIGNSGMAALAAALRSLVLKPVKRDDVGKETPPVTVFGTLDLSGCDITNVGAQALALALEDVVACRDSRPTIAARHLILAHNHIGAEGATALARALLVPSNIAATKAIEDTLNLSHNPLGDKGASALAAVLGQGQLARYVKLGSCQIHATGAAAMGRALRALCSRALAKATLTGAPVILHLDLSGNPLGLLQKSSKSADGGKYSASRLKSTATATAASYMNRIKQGWKDVSSSVGMGTDDSDDEEGDEEDEDDSTDEAAASSLDSKEKRTCGIKALVNAFLGDDDSEKGADADVDVSTELALPKLHLALRQCCMDHGAVDALAALVVEARDRQLADISLDVSMNPVLEDEMVSALQDKDDDAVLEEMAERYMDLWHAIQESKQRAAQARARARAQLHEEEDQDDEAWSLGGISESEDDQDTFRRLPSSHAQRRQRLYEDSDGDEEDDAESSYYDERGSFESQEVDEEDYGGYDDDEFMQTD